ncbi:MAG: FtsX-like permease family protein [Spirochaetia bacterium]|jgi:putative ABC transport system permease protein|nr:FtsX-like permease family protein [Spirochaetia bacterium]
MRGDAVHKEYALTSGRLSIENLKRRPFRTACLVVVVAILAFTLFGGTILTANLKQGMTSMSERFGADIMVVPEGAADKTEALLLRQGSGCFYFDNAVADKVAAVNGIAKTSPQFFLTSLSDSCCDSMIQLIAYDPETDFAVQPWITEMRSGGVKDGQLVVGSEIIIRPGNTIQFFGTEYPVAARLSKTGTGFDTSVFMTMNTMRIFMDNARNTMGMHFIADQHDKNAISAVLVKVENPGSSDFVASDIKYKINGVDVVVSNHIFSSIAETLRGFVVYVRAFLAAVWILTIVILTAVFSSQINERKKEFAILRILGATKKKLARIVLYESSFAALAGGIAGVAAASLIIFPFSTFIGDKLQLPYVEIGAVSIIQMVFFTIALSLVTGLCSSVYSAVRVSGAETYFTMREGE